MATSKENIISDIIVELEKGSNYAATSAVICGKFRLSERTFDKYWKIASQRFGEAQQAIQKDLLEGSAKAAKERLNKAILTKDERMEIASRIAKGESWEERGAVITPYASDRMKALDYLSKIEGDYAPTKIAETDSEGKDIDYTKLSTAALKEILNAITG